MAITLANTEYGVMGGGPGGKWIYTEATFDSSYAAGGETFTAAQLGCIYFKAIFIARSEDGYILDSTLSSDKKTVTLRAWVAANVTTSASVHAVDTAAGKSLASVVVPLLIRAV
jgi:hypothetical protein